MFHSNEKLNRDAWIDCSGGGKGGIKYQTNRIKEKKKNNNRINRIEETNCANDELIIIFLDDITLVTPIETRFTRRLRILEKLEDQK